MPTGQAKPVYVLHGGDGFLQDEHRHRIVQAVIGQADPQTAVTVFDSTASLAEVLDELRTMPFLAPRRAVLVRDADAFVSAYREPLEKYLESPSDCGTLILTVCSWPPKTRLARLVGRIGEVLDCSAPGEDDLVGWLRQAAGRRGKTLPVDAAELLVQWIGRDLAALDGEIEKLTAYVGPRKTITAQDAAALVTAVAGPGPFDLTNAITAGDVPAALKVLDGLLTRRGDEFKTLGLIAWHLRRVLRAQQLLATGVPGDRVVQRVRMPFSQQQPFLAMLRRRGAGTVQDDFRRLIHADLALKSSADPRAVMQHLVVALCS